MVATLESSVIRIYSNSGKVVGAGFLVSPKRILTCAHVVADALGLPRKTAEMPDAEISLDFPILAAKQLFKARVVFWRPVNPDEFAEDIAGLELDSSPPEAAQPARLITSDDLWRHPFQVLGFPAGQPNGVWADGELRAGLANGWVQLEGVKETGYRLEPGFSGAPIWDETLQGVAGMAVAAEINRPDAKAAFMIPTKVLCAAWTELGEQAFSLETLQQQWSTVKPATTEPELPEGQVELASKFYVKREPWESRCYQTIEKRAALIRIKAPRQMGKSSLLTRILYHAEQQCCRTVSLDFEQTDGSVFRDLNQFLRRFCALISRELAISPKTVNEYWDAELFGPKDNCEEYFEKCLLEDLNTTLVLALDKVDRVFPYDDVAREFLTMLRTWHEKSKVNNTWAKLRLVMVHSTEAYVVMPRHASPFNVGLPVDLSEFNPEQVLDLAQRHGLAWGSAEVEQIMSMVGGHPYLVRLALYHIAQQDLTLSQLLQQAPTDAGIYSDHLRQQLANLQQHPELMASFKQAVKTTHPVRLEAMQAYKLHGMGLVNRQGNDVTPRCDLYRLYFCDRLRIG
jgi:hypothetical protein